MRDGLRSALRIELALAHEYTSRGDFDAAFSHLERAHILSQRFTFAHAGVHLRMLHVGWKRRDAREVAGQSIRIVAALVFSRLWVPVGNTGGANVSAFRSMPLPADLATLLDTPTA